MGFVAERSAGEAEGIYGPESLTWEVMREPLWDPQNLRVRS